ncbi:hypothetical protein BC937DRAFT_93344, partial [Endogone sp. FLAS-F59071]
MHIMNSDHIDEWVNGSVGVLGKAQIVFDKLAVSDWKSVRHVHVPRENMTCKKKPSL